MFPDLKVQTGFEGKVVGNSKDLVIGVWLIAVTLASSTEQPMISCSTSSQTMVILLRSKWKTTTTR